MLFSLSEGFCHLLDQFTVANLTYYLFLKHWASFRITCSDHVNILGQPLHFLYFDRFFSDPTNGFTSLSPGRIRLTELMCTAIFTNSVKTEQGPIGLSG